jgi:hypothetical protein
VAGSIRLYKQASQASDENDVIFPTPEAQSRGVDAVTENLTILQQRWSGQPVPRTSGTGAAGSRSLDKGAGHIQ